jgi:hypothetical protein
VPVLARTVSLTLSDPEIDGRAWLRGGETAARIRSVAFDATVAEPSRFDAVTRTRSRTPASAFASV